jgi:hypothetical protein
MATMIQDDLLAKYGRDYSNDEAYGQLSVVDILTESVVDMVSLIPEISNLPQARREKIEEMIMLFGLSVYDSGKEKK